MKINGPSSVSANAAATGAKRASAGGFKVPGGGDQQTGAVGRTAGVTGVASVDALLALQQVDGPLERRRRAVKRATRVLDVLDDVRMALIDGTPSADDLGRLAAAVREQRDATGDAKLESVLDQIETRAAVELAKLESRGGGR